MRRTLFLIAVLTTASASAHDFWIEPTTFHPEAGAIVPINLRVGEHFAGDPVPRVDARIERFVQIDRSGERTVIGRDGGDPAGVVRIESGSDTMIVYRSAGSFIELDRGKYEQFIREEGIDWVDREREKRGESNAPWRESFSRCAKALIAGSASSSVFQKRVGLRLELVPETNPYALAAGATLPVRLEFEGRPLQGALVAAINEDDPSNEIRQRTDRRGRAMLPLTRGGRWLIKSVHAVRAPVEDEADWETLWASLTFEIAPRGR